MKSDEKTIGRKEQFGFGERYVMYGQKDVYADWRNGRTVVQTNGRVGAWSDGWLDGWSVGP